MLKAEGNETYIIRPIYWYDLSVELIDDVSLDIKMAEWT